MTSCWLWCFILVFVTYNRKYHLFLNILKSAPRTFRLCKAVGVRVHLTVDSYPLSNLIILMITLTIICLCILKMFYSQWTRTGLLGNCLHFMLFSYSYVWYCYSMHRNRGLKSPHWWEFKKKSLTCFLSQAILNSVLRLSSRLSGDHNIRAKSFQWNSTSGNNRWLASFKGSISPLQPATSVAQNFHSVSHSWSWAGWVTWAE